MIINKNKTASFTVDAQKTFTNICPNELPVPGGDEIVEALLEQNELASIKIGSKDWHNSNAVWIATEEKPQFSPVGLPNSDIHWNSHGIGGTVGAELLDGLPEVTDYDYFVWKGLENSLHPYSAIYHTLDKKLSTGVIEFLKDKGIDTVIVGGLAYSFCVKETAIDLAKAGFKVIVNKSATRDIPGFEEKTNLEFEQAGVEVVNDLSLLTIN